MSASSNAMFAIIHLLATFIADLFKPPRRLEVENLFLRHHLLVARHRGVAVRSRHVAVRHRGVVAARRTHVAMDRPAATAPNFTAVVSPVRPGARTPLALPKIKS